MSKLITNTIRHTAGSADNLTLDNSQNVTVEGNLTVDGTTIFTGDCTLPDDTVDIADLSATGTASSSTYLRGDNAWAAISTGFETEEYDEWRLTTAFTGGVNPLTSNLERPDTGNFEKIGTGVSQSSGVWTFPSTGKWLITTNSAHYKSGAVARWCGSKHHTTVDNGSNWVQVAQGYAWVYYDSNATGNTTTVRTLFDCTNTSTHKFKWEITDSDNDGTTCDGDTNRNITYISFWKIGGT